MTRARFGDKAPERALSLGLDFAHELGKLTSKELQTLAVELNTCADDPLEYVWKGRVYCDLSVAVNNLLRKTGGYECTY